MLTECHNISYTVRKANNIEYGNKNPVKIMQICQEIFLMIYMLDYLRMEVKDAELSRNLINNCLNHNASECYESISSCSTISKSFPVCDL